MNIPTPDHRKGINYSFDDTYEILQELTEHESEYCTIFDCKKLAKLNYLHETYDAKFSLFCFEKAPDFEISCVTTKFRNEFEENSSWLKFGFHGKDRATKFDSSFSIDHFEKCYENVEQAIIAFAGEESVCHAIRLHFFKCTKEQKQILRKHGITALFAADDSRISYDLSEDENQQLLAHRFIQKDMSYYATDLRLELVHDLQSSLQSLHNFEHVSVFTHEYEFDRQIDKLEAVISWFYERGYRSCFFEE